MWPYGVLFALPVWFAISHLRPVDLSFAATKWSISWHIMFAVLVLMIGLRHEVGGDWLTYLEHLDQVVGATLSEAITLGDPAYSLLNWLADQTPFGIYLVNTVCAALFAWGLLAYCRAQPRPWLALVVAVPYLVIVVAMGYSRQGVAIGLAMMGLVALERARVRAFVFWITIAALFHKSALILIPLAAIAGTKRKLLTVFLVGIIGALLFVLLLQESLTNLQYGYLEQEYESSGAAIRIAMNALPAFLFLVFRRRFGLPTALQTFWTWMSLSALAFVILLKLSPSSTAVDRVALYWIPLQLFVWSRLPNAMGQRNGLNSLFVYGVVSYSAAVLFVWLVFAKTAFAWLPYKFYPWVWLWQ